MLSGTENRRLVECGAAALSEWISEGELKIISMQAGVCTPLQNAGA